MLRVKCHVRSTVLPSIAYRCSAEHSQAQDHVSQHIMDVDCMVQNAANKRKTMAKTSSDKIGEWVIEKPNRNVLVMRHTTTTRLAERRCLLVGDCHWDNPDCDREHLAADLQSAVDGNCPILIGGDFFCAMQGKYDSRSSKNALRPEHANSNYLDKIGRASCRERV